MVEKKTLALGMFLAFAALTLFLGFNADSLAIAIEDNGYKGLFWYFISDFKNWIIIGSVLFFKQDVNALKRLGAGVLVALAADIPSYPRLLTVAPTVGEAIRASLDWIVISRLPFDYITNYYLFYVGFPLILTFGAFYLLGFRPFLRGAGV